MDGSTLSDLLNQPLVAAAIILVAIAGMVLWLLVPFAVFATNSLLRQQRRLLSELLAEQRRTNALLHDRPMSGGLSVPEDLGAEPSGATETKGEPVLALPREAEEAAAPPGPASRRRRDTFGLTVDKTDRVL